MVFPSNTKIDFIIVLCATSYPRLELHYRFLIFSINFSGDKWKNGIRKLYLNIVYLLCNVYNTELCKY